MSTLPVLPPRAPAREGQALPHSPAELDRYLDILSRWAVGQRSRHTALAYGRAAQRLNLILRQGGRLDLALHPSQIGDAEARETVAALRARYSPATVQQTLAALTGLWDALSVQGVVTDNPWRRLRRDRPECRVSHRYLTEDEVRRLFRAAQSPEEHVLLRTLYYCGLRVSEAVALDWGDVSEHSGTWTVTVYGKGQRTREQTVPQHLLVEWLEVATSTGDAAPVLVTEAGQRWTRFGVYHRVRSCARRADLPRMPSPHWLRHSAAVHLLDHGTPVHEVQAWLGHANLATTSIYTQITARPRTGEALPVFELE